MIIKKPYIFLIKHFRQIHIFLLVMGLFIYIKHTSLVTFIRDFMEYTAYDPTTDPISKYIPFWYLLIVLIIRYFYLKDILNYLKRVIKITDHIMLLV